MKNDNITYDNIRKIKNGQGDDYITGCQLDHPHFKENYKMIAIDRQALDADPKAIQHINFTRNLDRAENRTIFFILEAKETIFHFSQRSVRLS